MSFRSIFKYGFITAMLMVFMITSMADAQPSLYTRVRVGATGITPALEGGATQSITFDQIGTGSVPLIAPTSWTLDPLYSGVGQGSASASYGLLAGYTHVERPSLSPNYF